MRKTATSLLVVALLGTGVLVAAPAFASFGVLVAPPAGVVYSPSGGPATVTFTFAPGDSATVFTVRIRRPGHGTIREKDYLVDPAVQPSPYPVLFTWKDLSVATSTVYVIDVRLQSGGPVITSEPFTLRPALVSRLSANPSPFYPLVQDGYKDHTTIGFSLAADTTDTVVHVFADDAYGRCCSTEIRTEVLGPLASGAHTWAWDGAKGDASPAPKGTYFAKVEATDTNAVSVVSKAQRVEITKGTIRLTATKEKVGSAYARVADEHGTRRGGDCIVGRNAPAHEVKVLCANAAISVEWDWALHPGERIESVSFTIDGGYYGCHRTVDHTKTRSILLVHAPPTSTCDVTEAKITYSYPVAA